MAIVLDRKPGVLVVEADLERYPFTIDCPLEGCTYSVAVRSLDEGYTQHAVHHCRKNGVMMSERPKSILEVMWEKLDATVAAIMEGGETSREYHKARASGMAEGILLLHHPYFESTDEISREALERYKARKAGADYETPGLGRRRNELPPGYRVGLHAARGRGALVETEGDIGTSSSAKMSRNGRGGVKIDAHEMGQPAPVGNLTPEQVAEVVTRHKQGFTIEMLAVAYKESELVIKRIVNRR